MKRNIASILILLVIISTSYSKRKQFHDVSNDEDITAEYAYGNEDIEEYTVTTTKPNSSAFDLRGKLKSSLVIDFAMNDPRRSVVCSPVSTLFPLAKLAFGANSKTQAKLLNVIGVKSTRMIKTTFQPLVNDLASIRGVTLNMVSKIYLSVNERLKRKFKQKSEDVFRSSTQFVDFENPGKAAASINEWIYETTNGNINNIISADKISPDTSLILINAVYFLGTWKKQFYKAELKDFHTEIAIRKIPMMTTQDSYKYSKADELDAQVVEIPYIGDGASFVIVLPNAENGLPVLLQKLKTVPDLLQDVMTYMYYENIILTIPKFNITSDLDLRVAFEKLGLADIFYRESGLTQIVEDKEVIVSKAVQKAVIDVNEYGAEASAATAIQIIQTSGVHRTIFNANHPFLFYVKVNDQQVFGGIYAG